jgi:hypothetical protein
MKSASNVVKFVFAMASLLPIAGSSLMLAQDNPAPPPSQQAKPETPKIPRPDMADESALQQTTFSRAVADALLRRLAENLRGHSRSLTASDFDTARLGPYFEQHMDAAFTYYESFHLYYKIIQLTGDGEAKGTIVADFDLESRPVQSDLNPRRQHARLRLEIERGTPVRGNAWHIVAMDPSNFFFEY